MAVAIQRLGATLRLEVAATGEAGPRDPDRVGIGLSNTRARLERLYRGAHRFELQQRAGGTSAIIEIPLRRAAGGHT